MAEFFTAAVSTRYYYSAYHFWAAKHFARLTDELEVPGSPGFNIQHRAYVTSTILSSVAFLDSAINELFDDVADRHHAYIGPLPDEEKKALLALGATIKKQRGGTLTKYKITLNCIGRPAFDETTQPYHDAHLLVKLRNELMHAHSVTQDSADMTDLSMALSKRFGPNRVTAKTGNPYFPDKCLGADCAKWAVQSATNFADEFFVRLGISPNYQRDQFGPA